MVFNRSAFFLSISLILAITGQYLIAQKGLSWTLPSGLVFYIGSIFLFVFGGSDQSRKKSTHKTLSRWTEIGWLILTFGLALFFRLYHMEEIPPGMTTEVASGLWLGYAIPSSGWNPYYSSGLALTHPDIPLWSFAWFRMFTPSQFSYGLFYAFLSVLAFPLAYLLFRDLAGPKVALGTVFLWGIMQWHVTLGRNGHPSISTLIYISGCLLFLRYGWKTGKFGYWIYPESFAVWGSIPTRSRGL